MLGRQKLCSICFVGDRNSFELSTQHQFRHYFETDMRKTNVRTECGEARSQNGQKRWK